jgi:hypothetical protein
MKQIGYWSFWPAAQGEIVNISFTALAEASSGSGVSTTHNVVVAFDTAYTILSTSSNIDFNANPGSTSVDIDTDLELQVSATLPGTIQISRDLEIEIATPFTMTVTSTATGNVGNDGGGVVGFAGINATATIEGDFRLDIFRTSTNGTLPPGIDPDTGAGQLFNTVDVANISSAGTGIISIP